MCGGGRGGAGRTEMGMRISGPRCTSFGYLRVHGAGAGAGGRRGFLISWFLMVWLPWVGVSHGGWRWGEGLGFGLWGGGGGWEEGGRGGGKWILGGWDWVGELEKGY